MGVATGCGFKEIYRFPHTTYPYSSCICTFLQQHPYFFFHFVKMILRSLYIYISVIYSLPKRENRQLKSANFDFRRFSRNPPNIIPANISGYTVVYIYIYVGAWWLSGQTYYININNPCYIYSNIVVMYVALINVHMYCKINNIIIELL